MRLDVQKDFETSTWNPGILAIPGKTFQDFSLEKFISAFKVPKYRTEIGFYRDPSAWLLPWHRCAWSVLDLGIR
jgi:hypothetical protein